MSGRGSTRANSAVAACALVMAVGLAGCGGTSGDGTSEAVTTSAAPKEAAPVKATPEPVLGLVDDEASADAAKAVVVKVLGNDTVTLKDGTSGNVEVALETGEFTVSVETRPGNGTAKVDGSTIVYTSAAGYGGTDEFTYRVDVAGAGAESLTGTAVVRITVTAPTPTPTPVKPRKPAPPKVVYANCDAVRAAGADPIGRTDPGYGPHLDRDGDGVGCEPYGGASGGSTGGSTGGSPGGSTGGGGGSTYYENCTAVRAAGAAPIHAGDPGYGRHLDRDGDGVGCE
ncbi:excalibur calcium-binding domain-containing protein [Streptomyces lunaelactis]|uniref:excalibur calcium-binding domain-containing protein n=1 Tax=Streptomyces lunaelactis TaxID=1535768 RepID=UPI0015859993|nr:excalibur calcium-binding domain-containing protein [Streptomyces lunaelactis]NUK24079.1 excalibur calcium-binding domain-containing protein [Streptomyces lunaelactis]